MHKLDSCDYRSLKKNGSYSRITYMTFAYH